DAPLLRRQLWGGGLGRGGRRLSGRRLGGGLLLGGRLLVGRGFGLGRLGGARRLLGGLRCRVRRRLWVLLISHLYRIESGSRPRSRTTVSARARSRLAEPTPAVFSSSPVASWKRRPNSSRRWVRTCSTSSSSCRSRSSRPVIRRGPPA